jgi:3-oxoacyl-[acyl-carrier protein] reductase/pteridine reductase
MVTRPVEEAPFELAGKVVLVTGAARRIGRDIALRLHAAGAKVAIHYSQSEDGARATAADCGGAPRFRANLESVAEIERLFAEVGTRCGRLDALVNNAARFTRKSALEVTEADWNFIHDVNLKAYFFCAQQAARMMRAQGSGGRIVNISSLGGLQPWAEHVPYCASKAGVIMMTRALAKALAPDITVNSVAPGFIPYESKDYTQTSEGMIRDTPARRAGSGGEIADAVMFFLGASNYITGQTIAVDGGLSLR